MSSLISVINESMLGMFTSFSILSFFIFTYALFPSDSSFMLSTLELFIAPTSSSYDIFVSAFSSIADISIKLAIPIISHITIVFKLFFIYFLTFLFSCLSINISYTCVNFNTNFQVLKNKFFLFLYTLLCFLLA